ncbi:MAG: tyrosine-type recombinase/integrase [Clostridia bacterium]|nr:tyrosine-type recombinase/integrase [Clostridia bacterium]
MAKPGSYRAQNDDMIDEKAFAICRDLPPFVAAYLSMRKGNSTAKTRLSYAYDIRHFFLWLRDTTSSLPGDALSEITIDVLAALRGSDIDAYVAYLWSTGNHYAGVHRKFCCLNSFFLYLIRKDLLTANPLDKAEKITKNESKNATHMVKLQPKEIPLLLDTVEGGAKTAQSLVSGSLSKRQRSALERNKVRDLAIFSILLGTGIRVSECVGINISDLDLENCILEVDRKGAKRQRIALSDEVIAAIKDYLQLRESITPASPLDEDALFLSERRRRMCVQTVEALVRKYTVLIGTKEHITPHKLRKTYGTELYNETGDIFLVAQALGHNDVNTTKQYYVEESTENLLRHRNVFQMRTKKNTQEEPPT